MSHSSSPDTPSGHPPYRLQLALWQIRVHIREARAAADQIAPEDAEDNPRAPAERDAIQAETTLKVHRAIERMFKVLLGGADERGLWTPPSPQLWRPSKGHELVRLHELVGRDRGEQGEALNAVYGRIAAQHDHTMPMETFGQRLPVAMPSSPDDGFGIIMHVGGGGVEARDLRSLCAWMDFFTIYGLSYLGDVFDQRPNEQTKHEPRYFVHTRECAPLIDFIEAAEAEVVQEYARPFLEAANAVPVENPRITSVTMDAASESEMRRIECRLFPSPPAT